MRLFQFFGLIVIGLFSLIPYFTNADQEIRVKRPEEVDNINKSNDLGVGIKFGNLGGIDLKYWVTENDAAVATVGAENGNTIVSLDYLWHFHDAFTNTDLADEAALVPYVGAGFTADFGGHTDTLAPDEDMKDDFKMGAEIPIGLEFTPKNQKFGVFGEVKPSMRVIPSNYSFLIAGFGARFYF